MKRFPLQKDHDKVLSENFELYFPEGKSVHIIIIAAVKKFASCGCLELSIPTTRNTKPVHHYNRHGSTCTTHPQYFINHYKRYLMDHFSTQNIRVENFASIFAAYVLNP